MSTSVGEPTRFIPYHRQVISNMYIAYLRRGCAYN